MTHEISKLSIIIPAYNEEKTIAEVLNRISNLELYNNLSSEILVVNDCSGDQTESVIQRFIRENNTGKVRYFKQELNQGKGAAIHRGIREATGDLIIIQDADLELIPEEINFLLKESFEGPSRVVYGSRFLEDKHSKTNFVWHILGNGFLTRLSNLFSGLRLTDMMTCYKLVPREIIQSLNLKEKRFGFEPEITMKLAKIKGLTVSEVAISYEARTKSEGKKISWKDGMKVIWCVIRYRFGN